MTIGNRQIMENELYLCIFRKEYWVQELEVIIPMYDVSRTESEIRKWVHLYPNCNVWATWDINGEYGGYKNWE
jgi:hypothetical protein